MQNFSIIDSVLNGPGPRQGPAGGTAKSPGGDGTAQGSPSSSVNSQDGRHYEGRRAPRCEKILGGGRPGVVEDGGTAGHSRAGGKTAEKGGRRQKTAGEGEG